jgi:hypothetical protein
VHNKIEHRNIVAYGVLRKALVIASYLGGKEIIITLELSNRSVHWIGGWVGLRAVLDDME